MKNAGVLYRELDATSTECKVHVSCVKTAMQLLPHHDDV